MTDKRKWKDLLKQVSSCWNRDQRLMIYHVSNQKDIKRDFITFVKRKFSEHRNQMINLYKIWQANLIKNFENINNVLEYDLIIYRN